MKRYLNKFIILLCLGALLSVTTGCDLLKGSEETDKQIKELQDQVADLQAKLEESEKAPKATEEDTADDDAAEDDDVPEDVPTRLGIPPTETQPKSDYTGLSFVDVHWPKNESSQNTSPIYFKGTVSPDTVKIGVKATNSKTTQVDDYILQNYKAGSETFSYGAAEKWSNLMDGRNTYVFTAYFEDGSSKSTKITIYYYASPGYY